MHLTLKKEATRPARIGFLQRQDRFDRFLPHEALGMKMPAEIYTPSPRALTRIEALNVRFHDLTLLVAACGQDVINLSAVLAGETLGIKEVEESASTERESVSPRWSQESKKSRKTSGSSA